MSKLIVITGLDGSGTTTVARACVNRDPGAGLFRTPDRPFKNGRRGIDTALVATGSVAAHFFYYLASVADASHRINEHLAKVGTNAYCVRYLIDTVVSHRAAGLPIELTYNWGFVEIRKPDLIVLLSVSEETRQKRLRRRGKGFLDRRLDDPALRTAFLAEFGRFSDQLVKLECDLKSPADLAMDIIALTRTIE